MTEYTCPICQDTHWVYPRDKDNKLDYSQTIRCKCMAEIDRQEKWARLLKYCKLPTGSEKQTLETFNTKDNKTLTEAKVIATQIASGLGDVKWFTLIGKTDTGKSHLAKAITREWLNRGVPARYGFVPDLLLELKNGFELEGEGSFRVKMDTLQNIPLLVLDDLGTEKMTAWAMETIQLVINHRYENQLHLIVTSNRPLDMLLGNSSDEAHLASQRIASRLQRESWCKVITIDAPRFNAGRKS